MIAKTERRFSLGQIVATPGASDAMNEAGDLPGGFLLRHAIGDWGEVPRGGAVLNDLAVIDEYTLDRLAIETDRSFAAADVIDVLRYLFAVRGMPEHLRSDKGPEFVAHSVRR